MPSYSMCNFLDLVREPFPLERRERGKRGHIISGARVRKAALLIRSGLNRQSLDQSEYN